ncbi:Bone morphogenetic protein 7 [Holothuria leucospilota]|uniref:Bone morphogenetic protein 7 n=1 Tax=Holothuria leucospilota TaxID=206669 RepID=A0A9Q1HHC6_HOLLE|nr:Bone morphogenetic protein 7 [Holothuria leucospilota]
MYDEKFTSRQQFYLVFTQNQPAGANPNPNGTTHNEDWERSEEVVVEVADESSFTNDFGARGKYVEHAGFHIGKYQVYNATEIIPYARAGNGSQLVIKASVHLGNLSVEVKNFIVTTPGNAKSPLLVAFDNPHLESYIRFLTQNRGQPIEGYEHPPNSHDDGLTTPDKRPKRETKDDCRLRDWYVSFNDINWRELVYVPAGYSANFCHGSCHLGSPLRVLNATWPVSNHALLRSLFRHQMRRSNLSGPQELPPHSCCVPVQFEPLTMLYLEMSEPTSFYVLKSVPNMVATKCGCA